MYNQPSKRVPEAASKNPKKYIEGVDSDGGPAFPSSLQSVFRCS